MVTKNMSKLGKIKLSSIATQSTNCKMTSLRNDFAHNVLSRNNIGEDSEMSRKATLVLKMDRASDMELFLESLVGLFGQLRSSQSSSNISVINNNITQNIQNQIKNNIAIFNQRYNDSNITAILNQISGENAFDNPMALENVHQQLAETLKKNSNIKEKNNKTPAKFAYYFVENEAISLAVPTIISNPRILTAPNNEQIYYKVLSDNGKILSYIIEKKNYNNRNLSKNQYIQPAISQKNNSDNAGFYYNYATDDNYVKHQKLNQIHNLYNDNRHIDNINFQNNEPYITKKNYLNQKINSQSSDLYSSNSYVGNNEITSEIQNHNADYITSAINIMDTNSHKDKLNISINSAKTSVDSTTTNQYNNTISGDIYTEKISSNDVNIEISTKHTGSNPKLPAIQSMYSHLNTTSIFRKPFHEKSFNNHQTSFDNNQSFLQDYQNALNNNQKKYNNYQQSINNYQFFIDDINMAYQSSSYKMTKIHSTALMTYKNQVATLVDETPAASPNNIAIKYYKFANVGKNEVELNQLIGNVELDNDKFNTTKISLALTYLSNVKNYETNNDFMEKIVNIATHYNNSNNIIAEFNQKTKTHNNTSSIINNNSENTIDDIGIYDNNNVKASQLTQNLFKNLLATHQNTNNLKQTNTYIEHLSNTNLNQESFNSDTNNISYVYKNTSRFVRKLLPEMSNMVLENLAEPYTSTSQGVVTKNVLKQLASTLVENNSKNILTKLTSERIVDIKNEDAKNEENTRFLRYFKNTNCYAESSLTTNNTAADAEKSYSVTQKNVNSSIDSSVSTIANSVNAPTLLHQNLSKKMSTSVQNNQNCGSSVMYNYYLSGGNITPRQVVADKKIISKSNKFYSLLKNSSSYPKLNALNTVYNTLKLSGLDKSFLSLIENEIIIHENSININHDHFGLVNDNINICDALQFLNSMYDEYLNNVSEAEDKVDASSFDRNSNGPFENLLIEYCKNNYMYGENEQKLDSYIYTILNELHAQDSRILVRNLVSINKNKFKLNNNSRSVSRFLLQPLVGDGTYENSTMNIIFKSSKKYDQNSNIVNARNINHVFDMHTNSTKRLIFSHSFKELLPRKFVQYLFTKYDNMVFDVENLTLDSEMFNLTKETDEYLDYIKMNNYEYFDGLEVSENVAGRKKKISDDYAKKYLKMGLYDWIENFTKSNLTFSNTMLENTMREANKNNAQRTDRIDKLANEISVLNVWNNGSNYQNIYNYANEPGAIEDGNITNYHRNPLDNSGYSSSDNKIFGMPLDESNENNNILYNIYKSDNYNYNWNYIAKNSANLKFLKSVTGNIVDAKILKNPLGALSVIKNCMNNISSQLLLSKVFTSTFKPVYLHFNTNVDNVYKISGDYVVGTDNGSDYVSFFNADSWKLADNNIFALNFNNTLNKSLNRCFANHNGAESNFNNAYLLSSDNVRKLVFTSNNLVETVTKLNVLISDILQDQDLKITVKSPINKSQKFFDSLLSNFTIESDIIGGLNFLTKCMNKYTASGKVVSRFNNSSSIYHLNNYEKVKPNLMTNNYMLNQYKNSVNSNGVVNRNLYQNGDVVLSSNLIYDFTKNVENIHETMQRDVYYALFASNISGATAHKSTLNAIFEEYNQIFASDHIKNNEFVNKILKYNYSRNIGANNGFVISGFSNKYISNLKNVLQSSKNFTTNLSVLADEVGSDFSSQLLNYSILAKNNLHAEQIINLNKMTIKNSFVPETLAIAAAKINDEKLQNKSKSLIVKSDILNENKLLNAHDDDIHSQVLNMKTNIKDQLDDGVGTYVNSVEQNVLVNLQKTETKKSDKIDTEILTTIENIVKAKVAEKLSEFETKLETNTNRNANENIANFAQSIDAINSKQQNAAIAKTVTDNIDVDAIYEKVYARIERALTNEKRRMGL